MRRKRKHHIYFEKSKNVKLISTNILCCPNCINFRNMKYCIHISTISPDHLKCFLFPNLEIPIFDDNHERRKKITDRISCIGIPETCIYLKSQRSFSFFEK